MEVTKGTLAVLLVLVVAFSFVGTWMVMSKEEVVQLPAPAQKAGNTVEQAKVNLNYVPPATGQAKIGITTLG